MPSHSLNDKLMIDCFQDSLSRASLKRYMNLDRGQIKSWRDLEKEFMKKYKIKVNIFPDMRQLQNMTKKDRESFKEYAQ